MHCIEPNVTVSFFTQKRISTYIHCLTTSTEIYAIIFFKALVNMEIFSHVLIHSKYFRAVKIDGI